jgi:hypothetical protein
MIEDHGNNYNFLKIKIEKKIILGFIYVMGFFIKKIKINYIKPP